MTLQTEAKRAAAVCVSAFLFQDQASIDVALTVLIIDNLDLPPEVVARELFAESLAHLEGYIFGEDGDGWTNADPAHVARAYLPRILAAFGLTHDPEAHRVGVAYCEAFCADLPRFQLYEPYPM